MHLIHVDKNRSRDSFRQKSLSKLNVKTTWTSSWNSTRIKVLIWEILSVHKHNMWQSPIKHGAVLRDDFKGRISRGGQGCPLEPIQNLMTEPSEKYLVRARVRFSPKANFIRNKWVSERLAFSYQKLSSFALQFIL